MGEGKEEKEKKAREGLEESAGFTEVNKDKLDLAPNKLRKRRRWDRRKEQER